jgi:PAS domain S-box-containing protein
MELSRLTGRRIWVVTIVGVCAVAGLLAVWRFMAHVPPLPRGPVRIGFESNPPIQIRTDNGFSGISVDTVSEAARRAGIQLRWIETGTSSEEAFRKGLVDLWPLMVDLPERHKLVHIARPWMPSGFVLLHRADTPSPDRGFRGRIAVFKLPLNFRLSHERFPNAQIVQISPIPDVIKAVCTGQSAAAFLETRVAQSQLRERPPECKLTELHVQTVSDVQLRAGLASTFEMAAVADRIQHEIDNMFRDGTLAFLIAKYSYFGLDDTYALYERTAEEQRWRWITLLACGLILTAGVVLWLASSLRQQRRVEAVLRGSEERFRTMANTVPVIIFENDAAGNATFFNRQAIAFTGRTLEQLSGYGWLETVHPNDLERITASHQASLETPAMGQRELRLRRSDGQYRWMLVTASPLFVGSQFTGYLGTIVDITDLKRTHGELLSAQKLESLGVLANGIGHDFNNILGAILSQAELMSIELGDNSPARETIEEIQRITLRGSETVRQLMAYAGQETPEFRWVDLAALIGEMQQLLRLSISKHARLDFDLPQDLPAIRANAAQIGQVVMNLVMNGSEAIGERGGVIRVRGIRVAIGPNSPGSNIVSLPEGLYVRLEISDTGCGIPEEIRFRIFDPFFTTKFAGRGLGLASVQGIVQGHGGAINVVSSRSTGTVFEVYLPAGSEVRQDDDVVQGPASAPGQRTAFSQAVLVIEDEESLRNAVCEMLRKKNFPVFEAKDGTSGIEIFRARHADIGVVLLDLTMPGMPGREVLSELKRIRPEVKIVVTTAYSQDAASASLDKAQVWTFIRKPYQIADLVELLNKGLGS